MKDALRRLTAAGVSEPEAAGKVALLDRARRQVSGETRQGDEFAAFVPGRIEVLGKHTDYAGGRSLLCAAERGICVVARPRADLLVRVSDVVWGTRAETVLDAARGAKAEGWALYVDTVARRLARNFPEARRGADVAFGSDLPVAAGMSSSSALVTALTLALSALNELPATERYRANIDSREDLAEYLGTIENGQDFRALAGDAGVGTFGGSEDHAAMLCCRAGELSQYSFCPVSHERQLPMPRGCRFVVGVTGVVAEKTGDARETYNRASLAARGVLDLWNGATGRSDATLRAAVESAPDGADRVRRILGELGSIHFRLLTAGENPRAPEVRRALLARFDQFVEETFVIIPAVGDCLAARRLDRVPELVARSQAGAETGLGNQVPETMFLARTARENGAIAASAFGAGFGGSVWALANEDDVEAFRAKWSAAYFAAFPQHAGRAQFFTTHAGPSAVML